MRLIARLDIKGTNLIKGVQFEGYRKLGDPAEFSANYAKSGAHELLFVDTVASLYGQDPLIKTLRAVTERVFIPITVAGGISQVPDALLYLENGADKIAVNTHALLRPGLLKELVSELGSQSVVASIEAKRVSREFGSTWECMMNFGRDRSGKSVVDWMKEVSDLGVGEILLTSVDSDGLCSGYDLDLRESVADLVSPPIIYSGGINSTKHIRDLNLRSEIDGVAIGTALHFGNLSCQDTADFLNA